MADGEKVKREHLEGDRREEKCAKDPGRQTIHRDPVGNAHDPDEIHNDVRDVVVRVSVGEIFQILAVYKKCNWLLIFCALISQKVPPKNPHFVVNLVYTVSF